MPQKHTAEKELRKNKTRHERNLVERNKIKVAIKKLKKCIEAKDLNACKDSLKDVFKVLDKAASKKLIHRNKAARKKSSFSKLINKIKPAA